jgi:hypothetical protein
MRLDSVETAIRQNSTCAVHEYASAREAGSALPALDLSPRAFPLPQAVTISEGNRIRVLPGEKLSGECARQAAADRLGTLDVTPLLWRGDLPGLAGEGTMFVRDLGPEMNLSMIAAHPERQPYVLMVTGADRGPELTTYAAGMDRLWGQTGGGE